MKYLGAPEGGFRLSNALTKFLFNPPFSNNFSRFHIPSKIYVCLFHEKLRVIFLVVDMTHYSPVFLSYPPPKNIRKPLGFLMFSGDTEKQHRAVID